ncbi:hypothetical protein Patl1_31900 [Pistacia atlantica]|uniref:Uncharacterized protein n=1 Tax=Pistacia atlantica TaxID=434234 RepID=A0ACC1ANB7_9ROSI|nr:hypothetical protein Patl1_31900 [Pistacia atlantica]
MSFSSCLKCYPWPHPQPLLSFSHKPIISFASTQHHDQPLTATSLSTSPHQLPPNFTSSQLLDTLRRQRDESSALRLFSWASKQPSFTPTLSVYEEILSKLGKVGSFDSMTRILEEIKASGCQINPGTFLIFIESYAKFDLYDEILGVTPLMQQEFGLVPDTHFYNFLLNVLVDGNKLKLVETAHSDMTSRGIKPDVSTFNILIKALCRAHQIRPAMLMMEEMPGYGLAPDEKTFTTLMQGFIEEGNINAALRIKEHMVETGCQVTNVTVNVLVHGLCKEGRVDDALSFIEEMTKDGFYPDQYTFNTLIRRVQDAAQLMDQMIMEGLKPDKFTYNSLLTYFCRAGDIKKAADIVQTMTSNGCEPDIVTYGTLIGGLCKAGRVEVASKLLRSIQIKGIVLTPHAYNPVIQALFKRKRTTEAMRLFREMMEKGDPPDAVTYKFVFRGLCSGGGPISEAVDFVVEMLEKGFLPEFSSFYMLAEGLCSLSMEDTLVNLIDMVMDKAKFSASEASMIRGFLKIQKFKDALGTFGDILDSRNPRKAYWSR